jgi:hypothetical protein
MQTGNQGILGLAPKIFSRFKTEIPTFLDQAHQEGVSDGMFSVFYSLNTKLQSKVIFGAP